METLLEVRLPAFGKGGDLQGTAGQSSIVICEPFCDVQASDSRDGDGAGVLGEEFDFIPSGDFSFAGDGEVETGAAAGEEALHHVVGLEADAQFVAREARLGDHDFRRADGKPVAEMDRVFQQAFGGEVFSKDSQRQIPAGQLFLPVDVVFERVAIDGFVLAAVDGEVRLTVAVQIELVQSDAARDGLLEDGGSYDSAVPGDFAGEPDIYGD